MKTMTRVLSLTLVAVMLVAVLVSCGSTLSGTYALDSDIKVGETTLTFKGSKVTYKYTLGAVTATKEGTYSIKDGKITLTIDGSSDLTGEFDFAKDGKTITIGGVNYTKK